MRLWSIHPRYLDSRGLVALWREGLLARAVLRGLTRGYRHHPQLERFRAQPDPLAAIDCYLARVLDESRARGYAFDASKLCYQRCHHAALPLTNGQLEYEWQHLLAKLKTRDPLRWQRQRPLQPSQHPCFQLAPGPVAVWERR
ncbi:MAG: DNA lyase [Proteobacteria bacterium]|nr:DNA lyase [Pseudomonadota bacterium]